jgi:hypothetical protein
MAVKNAGNTGPTKAQQRAAERDWNQRVASSNLPPPVVDVYSPAEYEQRINGTYSGPTTAPPPPSIDDPDSASNVQSQADAAQALRDEANRNWQTKRDQAENLARQKETIAAVQAIFKSYGLESLYSTIEQYAKQDYSASTVALMLRDTPEYAIRFPAMKTLNAKKKGFSEAEYIEYERAAAAYEVQYGLPSGMLKDSVTGLLEADISAAELLDRVQMSSASSISAPQELKDTLKNYYGIDSGGLAGYFLDPTIAAPILQRRYNAGLIGSEAARQKVDLGVATAENLQGLGVDQAQAREGFAAVAGARGLTQGRGDVTSNRELIDATLGGNAAAQSNVARAAKAKVGKFEGGGNYVQDGKGGSGLGSSSTR